MGLSPDFELMFERFEILSSLAHVEGASKEQLRQSLEGSQSNYVFTPVGRGAWRSANKLVSDMQEEPHKTTLLRAGFAKGDPQFLELFVQNFSRIAARMHWR